MTTQAGRATIHMVYAGRRLNGSRLTHAWRDESGEYYYWDKLIGRVIGGIYSVQTDPESVGTVYPGTLEFTGERVSREDITVWEIEDRTHSARHAVIGREKREAKEQTFGTNTLDQMRETYRRTIGHAQRSALLASIIEEVTR
jgi:hypothetical protein